MAEPDDSRDERIAELIDFYLGEVRTGSDGDALVQRLLADNPDVADELKRLLPALAAAENLGTGISSAATAAAAPIPHASAPARLGAYAIERELGRGGMGVVYLALEDGTGRRVALKLLPPGASGKAAERFLREARIAAALEHPGIVPILAVGEEGGWRYLAMRFVDGANLHEVTKRAAELGPAELTALVASTADGGALEPVGQERWYRAVAELGRDAATALAAAHGEGVLHRDIKPANLMLDRKGRVALADFGLARAVGDVDLTSSQSVVGTLQYMAPEQLRKGVEERSDIYALGLCLLELAARKPAFQVDSQAQLLEQIVRRGPPRARSLDPGMPAGLAGIIDAACAHRVEQRYADAASLAADLAAFAAGEPVRAPRASPLRWLALATLVLIAAGIGIWQLDGDPEPPPTPPPQAAPPPPDRPVAGERPEGTASVAPTDTAAAGPAPPAATPPAGVQPRPVPPRLRAPPPPLPGTKRATFQTADGQTVTAPPWDPRGFGIPRDANGFVMIPPGGVFISRTGVRVPAIIDAAEPEADVPPEPEPAPAP